MNSTEKGGTNHQEVLHDHDVLAAKSGPDGTPSHLGELSAEELATEKKLRFKIDSLIMPLVIVVYLMNYIDRNNFAAARLQGLVTDLNLSSAEYQTCLSILFVAYVLMQVPSNLLLNYMGRPSLYLGFFICAWGLVSLLTSQVKGYGGMVACRFVLGFVEAPFFSGVLFYLSKWYTKEELSLRMSIFYSASLLSGAFGNLIAAGILNGLSGARGIAPWQWLYIIEGAITIFIGLIVAVVLPDFPDTWTLLKGEEKAVANRRLALEAAEVDIDEPGGASQIKGMVLAFKDPKTYILAVAYHGITGAAGFQNFFPSLTRALGYSDYISLILVAPPYLFMVLWSAGHSLASDRLGNRFWFYMYPVPLVIAGCLIFMFANGFGARYFSFFLLIFIFAQNGILYAWIANAIPRPPAKRAAALAFINSFGNAASIWTPFTYPTNDPYYRVPMGINIGLTALGGICGIIMRVVLTRENARLERMQDEDATLTQRDIKRLQRTADAEGIDLAAARRLQKGYRYII